MKTIAEIEIFAKQIRLLCLDMAHACGSNGSHLGGGLSPVEIFATLFGRIMNLTPQNRFDKNRDRLVVSKGHCVLSYYAALHLSGLIDRNAIDSFEVAGSHFHGHAMRNLQNGIEFSGGSLSMGMSFAVGQAYACRAKGYASNVYCLVGDGECNEGLIWEAAMAAANFQLSNLKVIVDKNNLQYDGPTASVMNTDSLKSKFEAFGFDTTEVDGHSVPMLLEALTAKSTKPRCIIADTVKGKGVSFMEGIKEWHHHTLSPEQYKSARKEVCND